VSPLQVSPSLLEVMPQEIFAAIFQHAAIGIALINGAGSIRDVNPFFCQILGYNRKEMIGQRFRDFGHPDDYEAAAAGIASLIQGGDSPRYYSAERRYVAKDGHIITGRITVARTTDPFDRITIIVTIEDITQERAAQQALAKSQAYLKRLSESRLVGITVGDQPSGQIVEANDTFLRILGYTRDDLDDKKINWMTFTAPEYLGINAQAVAQIKETGWSPVFEKENIRKDGSRVPVLVGLAATDEPGKVVTWILDISRQKELEKQLLQTQKMEAVGQLAGGIAHDFNNLLMIIGAHTELLAMKTLPLETQAKCVGHIQSATKQAAQLTRKLLAFSRKQELAATDFEVGQMVQETIELVSPSLSKNVEVTFRKGAECWVRADHGQLEQVVVNFVLNARDAMPCGGRIVIDTSGVVVSDVEVGLHDTVPAGEYALLKIADTGEGIPPEIIHRIFDPFFTTKPKDRGTGLGLAMVYGTVTQSGGYIRVKSSPNTGTTFCVYLPVISHAPVEETKREPCSRQRCPMLGTILVVDDEEEIRSSVRALLEKCGLAVEEASDATEALRKADTLGESLAVLVTDVAMPEVSGTELAYELRRKHSELPVVFMSGYAAGEQGHELFERVTFLQKPFSLTTLINAVYRVGRCPDANASKACMGVSDALTQGG
jgi:two-component system, cell cycle sensor histidine kinase and response regulator CckA